MRRPTVDELRAAVWAVRALRRARRDLAVEPLAAPALPAPPRIGIHASRGVVGALARQRASCLEAASVRQVWFRAHGDRRDLVIGVRSPDDFAAHAWLEGEEGADVGPYVELVRRTCP